MAHSLFQPILQALTEEFSVPLGYFKNQTNKKKKLHYLSLFISDTLNANAFNFHRMGNKMNIHDSRGCCITRLCIRWEIYTLGTLTPCYTLSSHLNITCCYCAIHFNTNRSLYKPNAQGTAPTYILTTE